MLLRQHDIDQIDLFRHVGECGVGSLAHNLRCGAVDRVKRPPEIALDEIVEQDTAGFRGVGRGADHRD